MKKKYWIIAGGVLTVLLLIGIVGAAVAYAQTPTPPTPPRGPGWGWRGGFGGGLRQLDQAALNAAAKALGITADGLSTQLKAGKTLAQIASAQGVDLQTVMQAIEATRPMMLGGTELDAAAKTLGMTSADLAADLKNGKTVSDIATEKGVNLLTVQDAIQAARNADFKAQIDQAVASGRMTQDKANWLLEGLSKGYLNGPGFFGFGFGFGQGGPHMHGGMLPKVTPTATP
jgi:hypothetical protein